MQQTEQSYLSSEIVDGTASTSITSELILVSSFVSGISELGCEIVTF